MPIFTVGVEIERTQIADLLVRVEASSKEEAWMIALKAARSECRNQPEAAKLFKGHVDWESQSWPEVRSISSEDYSDGYEPDVDLVNNG